jgi:uncharacterized membrane protein YadS
MDVVSWYLPFFLLSLLPFVTPTLALLMGLILALVFKVELPTPYRKLWRYTLQGSIVVLGFAMNPKVVWNAGTHCFLSTAATLFLTIGVGLLLARSFRIFGPMIEAEEEEISISLGLIYLLSSTGLLAFPFVGSLLHLSPNSFGYLAGVCLHDTTSVMGAAKNFSPLSVPIAMTVKLGRALLMVPIALLIAYILKRRANSNGQKSTVTIPWFVGWFTLAVGFHWAFPFLQPFFAVCGRLGSSGLNGAIFLCGAQINRQTLQRMRFEHLGLAISLWLIAVAGSIAVIRFGKIW